MDYTDCNSFMGRYSDSGFKLKLDSMMEYTEDEIRDIRLNLSHLYQRAKSKHNSFTKMLLSPNKTMHCFVKEHKCQFVIYDKKENALTQRITVEEARLIISAEEHIINRLENCTKLIQLNSIGDFKDILNAMQNCNGTRAGPSLDSDFDFYL